MSTVQVVWPMGRGAWDHGLLERLTSAPGAPGPLHALPRDYAWEHHDSWDTVDYRAGAVVVLAGAWVGTDVEGAVPVEAVNEHLRRLAWRIVVVLQDELGLCPWQELAAGEVWLQTPNPAAEPWPWQVLPVGAPSSPGASSWRYQRPTDVFFAGQHTHDRRAACITAIRALAGDYSLEVEATEGFGQGMSRRSYLAGMASAKVAPCPSGAVTQDTLRVWEALEAGAVPLLDRVSPVRGDDGYWDELLDGPNPLPKVTDWTQQLGPMVRDVLDGWPRYACIVQGWWAGYKRRLQSDLRSTVHIAAGMPPGPLRPSVTEEVASRLTVLVTASPVPDPWSHWRTVLDSLEEQVPGAEVIFGFDGVRPEDADLADRYYRAIYKLCDPDVHSSRDLSIVPWVADTWMHQANVLRRLLDMVETEVVLVMEHDTPLMGSIPWWDLLRLVEDYDKLDYLRLHLDWRVHPEHEPLMCGPVEMHDGVPIRRTAQWSQRPHLANAATYRSTMDVHFPRESRTCVEDRLHGVMLDRWAHFDAPWWQWPMAIYHPEGNIQRSWHTDGRAGRPKHEMHFATGDEQ